MRISRKRQLAKALLPIAALTLWSFYYYYISIPKVPTYFKTG